MAAAKIIFEKQPPKVSIIVPVYKVRKYIEECIYSVIGQTYRNIQLILVDDVGADGSIEIAESILISSEIEWFIIRHDKNRGQAAARNSGIKRATGDYIFFLDSDDYISSDCIEKLVLSIKQDGSNIAYGSYATICEGVVKPMKIACYEKYTCSQNPLELFLQGKIYTMGCNILFQSSLYHQYQILFKEGIIHEDDLWSFSLILHAKKICFVNGITYYYRRHTKSTTLNPQLTLYRLQCKCLILKEYYDLSRIHTINTNKLFLEWFLNKILFTSQEIMDAPLSKEIKIDLLNEIFCKLSLSDAIFKIKKFFFIFKKLSIILPSYKWLRLMFYFKKLKYKLKHKLSTLYFA